MANQYYEQIEKTASKVGDFALKKLVEHKKLLAGLSAGAGVAGGAYAVSDKKDKERIKNGLNVAKRSFITGQANDYGKEIASLVGTGLGTAIAMKRGKSLGRAVASGGIAGGAIGDILGAATIPTAQLYKKHKKEFGTAPDAKSLSAVLGANVGPQLALWGSLYGLKKGVAKRKAMSEGLAKGMESIGSAMKAFKADSSRLRNFDEYKANGGVNGLTKALTGHAKDGIKGAFKTMGAFAPLYAAGELATLPTYVATPENVIAMKKKKLQKQKELNNGSRD